MFQAFPPESFYQNSSASTNLTGYADVSCPTQPPSLSFYTCSAPIDTSSYTVTQFCTNPLYVDFIPIQYPQNTTMHVPEPSFYVSSLPQSSHHTNLQPLTASHYQTPLPFFAGCNPAQITHFSTMEPATTFSSLDLGSISAQHIANTTTASISSPAPLTLPLVQPLQIDPQSTSTVTPCSPPLNSPHSVSAQDPVLLGSTFPGSPRASSPSHDPENADEQVFLGERQVSKAGKFNVIIYRIPGTTRSFTFFRVYKTKNHEVYRCYHCRKERRRRGIRGAEENIKVVGNVFLSDPCRMSHECEAGKYTEERGNRHVYKELQKVRSDRTFAEKKPLQIYLDMVTATLDADDEEMEDSIRAAVRRSGYQARRRVIARSVGVWVNRSVNMECVPPEFRTLSDGSLFLHHQEPGFHIYYSVATIQRACENGLHSIVADGMHSLHPKSLGYHAQLYCVHGVCARGVEIPLLYCTTAKKTERVYMRIFQELRGNVSADVPKRIVLDFEKAAINAARKAFPRASVGGCAFHLAQAWNRKRDALALRRYTQGPERDERIVEWWNTLKGIVFLPLALLPQVRALRAPPVPEEHAAYTKCEEFLAYLQANWMSGPFKEMWCKWKLEELRTTNLAEAFHRRLGLLINVDHPPLSVLIDALRKLNCEARAALKRLQEDPENARTLQKRDENRRAKIAEEMRNFEMIYQDGATQGQIEEYCMKMSRFVTNTAI